MAEQGAVDELHELATPGRGGFTLAAGFCKGRIDERPKADRADMVITPHTIIGKTRDRLPVGQEEPR